LSTHRLAQRDERILQIISTTERFHHDAIGQRIEALSTRYNVAIDVKSVTSALRNAMVHSMRQATLIEDDNLRARHLDESRADLLGLFRAIFPKMGRETNPGST